MQILNRNWKKSNNNIKQLEEVVWKNKKIYLYIRGLKKDDLVLARQRNFTDEIIGIIEEVQWNDRTSYVATFEVANLGEKLNSTWDFYVISNNQKPIRLKSNLDFKENDVYKIDNKNIQLNPYTTVQYNFSVKTSITKTITNIKEISIIDNNINISLNMLTDKKISTIDLFKKNDKLKKYCDIKQLKNMNNYNNSDVIIKYSIEEILQYIDGNKENKLFLTITYSNGSEEELDLKVKDNFLNEVITFNNKKIYIYEKENELYIKYEDKDIEAQVTSIYSYVDKFIINGYIKSYLDEKVDIYNLLIVNRENKKCISQSISMIKNNSFKVKINTKDLLEKEMKDGVWDLYINCGDRKIRLESTIDDIENKQKVINIPQQIIGNSEDSYVYKLYYSLENEISLIIRKYINIKAIKECIFTKNKLILRGIFFVEPPLQVLPQNFTSNINIKGYYSRNYNLKSDIFTEQTSNRYNTNFNMKIDISILNKQQKKELRQDILTNTISLESTINNFNIKMVGVIDKKGVIETSNKINEFIKYNSENYMRKAYKIFNKILPIDNNMVIYQSFHGKSFSGNPKAIYKEIIKSKANHKGIWVLENPYTEVPKDTIIVKPNTLQYYYYMARAKYFVNNGNFPDFYEKRKGTIHLQTWHGTPLKKLGYDISKDSPSYYENNSPQLIRRNSRWDYLIGPNEYTSIILQRAFGFQKEMINSGYPRNDILYNYKCEEVNEIRNKLGIDKDKKIILYAPTWRDSDFHGNAANQGYNLKFNIENFKRKFGDTYVLLLRLHYRDASRLAISLSDKTVMNVSFYDDIQELYLISDVLITDYSSVMFDYVNLKRPMIFYCYDYLKYKNKMRGCYFNFTESAPGPIVFDEEQLFDAIDNLNTIKIVYKDNVDNFYDKFCEWEDGNASKRVVDTVFKSIH